jgi:hypothetical protein
MSRRLGSVGLLLPAGSRAVSALRWNCGLRRGSARPMGARCCQPAFISSPRLLHRRSAGRAGTAAPRVVCTPLHALSCPVCTPRRGRRRDRPARPPFVLLRHGSLPKNDQAVAAPPRSNSIGPHGSSRPLPSRYVASNANLIPTSLSQQPLQQPTRRTCLACATSIPDQPEPRQGQLCIMSSFDHACRTRVCPVFGPLARVPNHLPG